MRDRARELADRLAERQRRRELSHPPLRPSWDCASCGQAWPCPPARVELGERYADDRIGLAVYAGMQLDHAAREIPAADPADLYERFVRWTR